MKQISKILGIVVFFLAAFPATAEKLALILSFENYENGRNVRGALSVHDDLLAAYRDAGFQTIGGRDRSHAQLRRVLRNFAGELNDADTVVIHISGHIVNYGNQSWVLPSDTGSDSLVDIEIDGISIDFLTALLATKPGNSVLFLGMSEREFDDIHAVRRGIAVDQIPDGVMVVSGPFENVSRAVTRDFLSEGSLMIEAIANNRRRINVLGDMPFDLILADGARQPRVDRPEEIETSLRLNRNQRRGIQADLTVLGFGLGSVDGVFGNATRRAVRLWQQRSRLPQTGFLDRDQIRLMDQQADAARGELEGEDRQFWAQTGAGGALAGLRAYLDRYPDGLFSERAHNELQALEQNDDEDEWDRAASRDTLQSYQRYLQRYPDGIYNRLAKARVQEFLVEEDDDTDDEEARRIEERLRLDQSSRLLIELRLAGLGYRIGTAEGNFDDETRQGIRSYQDDRNLPETGYVNADMIRMLLLGR